MCNLVGFRRDLVAFNGVSEGLRGVPEFQGVLGSLRVLSKRFETFQRSWRDLRGLSREF